MKYGDATMGQTEAVINRMGGFENWLRFAGGQGKIVFDTILAFLRTQLITSFVAVTTSEEYFSDAGVKSMGENFKAQFLGLEVGSTDEVELAVCRLERNSLDAPILTELGDKAEINVSQFKAFLAGNRGSSEWFVFYLRGKDGSLWAVGARWYGDLDGWLVEAFSVGDRSPWNAGSQVVSRN